MQQHSQKFLRQRKFLVVAPFLVIPFLTMLFWALGGGKGSPAEAIATPQKGINTALPDPKLKDDRKADKMAFYEQATLDSMKSSEQRKAGLFFGFPKQGDTAGGVHLPAPVPNIVTGDPKNIDKNEAKAYAKISELNKLLDESSQPQMPVTKEPLNRPSTSTDGNVDRLENMLRSIQQPSGEDPDMTALNSALDKLLLAQHPEKAHTTKDSGAPKAAAVPVEKPADGLDGFKSASFGNPGKASLEGNTIRATVPETQVLVSGATIRLQLDNDIVVNGATVPAGTFIYGIASLSNERLMVTIATIRAGENIYPANLTLYDEDGMEGIYIPGAITRDAAKQSADQGINSFGVTTLDPSLAGQATAAGIQLAKTAFSRKIKLVRVTVTPGYRVWLKQDLHH